MKLSLSVRVIESACKTRLAFAFEDFLEIARDNGYTAVCMRASAAGVDTMPKRLWGIRRSIELAGLSVSMVTADFDVPLNNARGPNSLRRIEPSLDVAQTLGCDLLRVCLKDEADIPAARVAAEIAARRGVRLVHQCHTATLFEEVPAMLDVLRRIDHPNFGVIYEPANLLLCGQSYGLDTLQALRPYLWNVYLQNHQLDGSGPASLPTCCRGEVRFRHLDLWSMDGIDWPIVVRGLEQIGYHGFVTIHQAQGIETTETARQFARHCAEFLRGLESPPQSIR